MAAGKRSTRRTGRHTGLRCLHGPGDRFLRKNRTSRLFQVYPTNINLQRGIHRGLVKWSEKPKLIDTSIGQSVRETPAFKKIPSKPSLQHSMMDHDQVRLSGTHWSTDLKA